MAPLGASALVINGQMGVASTHQYTPLASRSSNRITVIARTFRTQARSSTAQKGLFGY